MMQKEVSGDEDWLDFELMIGLKKRTVCVYWLLNPFSFSLLFDFSPFLLLLLLLLLLFLFFQILFIFARLTLASHVKYLLRIVSK